MLNSLQVLTIILVVAVCTFLTRAIPFILFGKSKKLPLWVQYIGLILPPCIIGILIIYCFKDIKPLAYPYGLPQIIAVLVVALLHIWRKNTLLSIGAGTVVYMILIQKIF